MNVAVFSAKPYDKRFLENRAAEFGQKLRFLEPRLSRETAPLARECRAVCLFVNDIADREVLEILAHECGVEFVALRCAGFNNVDLQAAADLGITVVRVPAYSPYAVAEHTLALILTLNRQTHRSYHRVREGNFALEGLLGFDIHGKTVGVVGTGRIGREFLRVMGGFECRLLAFDPYPNEECRELGAEYVDLPSLLEESDIVSLHCPLTPETHHIIDDAAIGRMKRGVMLINTSRGALMDTPALIRGLKSGQIGYLGLDVYEEEADLFFEDLSNTIIPDDTFARLLTFPNVVITGHQAFFTSNALHAIAETTLSNLAKLEAGESCPNTIGAGVSRSGR